MKPEETDDSEFIKLSETSKKATELFLDRRALIFIEEAMAYYHERHGTEETIHYLQEQIDYFEQFKRGPIDKR